MGGQKDSLAVRSLDEEAGAPARHSFSEGGKVNNLKFLIEFSITQFSEFFNLKLIEKFNGFLT